MAHEERELRDVSELALVLSRIQLQVVEVISKRKPGQARLGSHFSMIAKGSEISGPPQPVPGFAT